MGEPPIAELSVAFILVLATSLLLYFIGRRLAPRAVQDESAQSAYACGEKASFSKIRVTVSLYKYLIYFVVLDSSVLLIAFVSLVLMSTNILILMLYLSIVLVSGFLLLGGGER